MPEALTLRKVFGFLQSPAVVAIAIGFITLLAAAIRLCGLETLSVWYDEGWTLYLTRLEPAEAIRQIIRSADPHPPGYYLLLIPWMRLWGHHAWAARAFSVLTGVAAIPAIYHFASRLFGRITGLLAAALLALEPAHIAYSREARMYPLLVLWVILLAALSYRYAYQRESWKWPHWLALVTVQSLALYTHFFAALFVVGLHAWIIGTLLREARRTSWRPLAAWLIGQGVVAVSLLPWLSVMLARALGHTTQSTYTPPFLDFVLETWSFLLAGQVDLFASYRLYTALAWAMLGTWLLGASWALWRGPRRREMAFLCFQVLVVLGGVYGVMYLRPGFHPRYLFILLPFVVVGVAWNVVMLAKERWPLGKVGAIGVLVLWLASTGLGGRLAAATNPWRDNARAVASYLRQELPSGSLVVAAYPAWELDYYLRGGPLALQWYGIGDFERGIVEALAAKMRQAPQIAYVRWRQSDTDFTHQITYTLAREGRLLEEREFPGYTVMLYVTRSQSLAVQEIPATARFGPLTLTGTRVAHPVAADDALTVALKWHLEAPVMEDLKVALALVDAHDRTIAQCDDLIRDAHGNPTSGWNATRANATYHVLSIPPGTPPLTYTLRVKVYHEGDLSGLDILDDSGAPAGKGLNVGAIALAPAQGAIFRPVDREALGLMTVPRWEEGVPGLTLAAYRLERDIARTGETLSVLLEWHNTASASLLDITPSLRLVRDGRVLTAEAHAPVYGTYPTSRWKPGEIVLEWREIQIPVDAPSGPATVEIVIPGQAPIALGAVEIQAVPHLFERPPMQHVVYIPFGETAALVGYDLNRQRVASGEQLVIVLYWQALAPMRQDFTVFVHLLNEEGRLIAQHDAPPALGARPTRGWIAGEFIRDEHPLHWLDLSYKGAASFEIGLYDALTGVRVPTASGMSYFLLPEAIFVE